MLHKILQSAPIAAQNAAKAVAESALHATPAAGGSGTGNAFQPLIPTILKPVGRQIPATQPVVRQPLPELAPGGANDANGTAPVDPIAAKMAILSDEKQKAKEYTVQAKSAKDDEPKLYDWDRDYSLLCIYKFGHH